MWRDMQCNASQIIYQSIDEYKNNSHTGQVKGHTDADLIWHKKSNRMPWNKWWGVNDVT